MATIPLSSPESPTDGRTGPLRDLVCGIDGSPSSYDAVRQAASLVPEGTTISLVAVVDDRAFGPVRDILFTTAAARKALARAAELADHHGLVPQTSLVTGAAPVDALLAASESADLLVFGGKGTSRRAGMLLGSTASHLVHRAHVPLLLTRCDDEDHDGLLRNVLVADGGANGDAAVRFAARVARGRAMRATLLRVGDPHAPERNAALAAATAELHAALGNREPVELLVRGATAHSILAATRTHEASLVVLGSRGLTGSAALRSVSERVAHEAPCSALIVRPPHEAR